MIPVEKEQLSKVDIIIRKHDSDTLKKRKQKLKQELDWCNEHSEEITNKARVLYDKFKSGEYFKRKRDCLDFIKLEKICKNYNTRNS